MMAYSYLFGILLGIFPLVHGRDHGGGMNQYGSSLLPSGFPLLYDPSSYSVI